MTIFRQLHNYRLGFTMLARDYKSGELTIICWAVILAVTCLTAINYCDLKIRAALNNKSAEMLGADRIVTQPFPFTTANNHYSEAEADNNKLDVSTLAAQFELTPALCVSFYSMASTGDKLELTEVKAVDQNYPLKGSITVTSSLDENNKLPVKPSEQELSSGPPVGEIWLEPRLAQALAVNVGDPITIGAHSFTVTKLIVLEPGNTSYIFAFAPRAMIAMADLAKTGALVPGSRVKHELMLTGTTTNLLAFDKAIETQLLPSQQLIKAEQSQSNINNTMDKALNFLQLAAMINIAMAGITIAIAGNRFAIRHSKQVGVLRCLGATSNQITSLYVFSLLILALILAIIGLLFGYLLAEIIFKLFIPITLKYAVSISWSIIALSVSLAIIMLFGFALPALLALRQISVLQVLRNNNYIQNSSSLDKYLPNYRKYLLGIIAFVLILYSQTSNYELATMFSVSLLAISITLALCAHLVLQAIHSIKYSFPSLIRLSLINTARRAQSNVVQITAFALIIAVVILLSVIKTGLLVSWKQQLPANTPNQFVINILPSELESFKATLQEQGIAIDRFYPLVRGQLVAINGEPVSMGDELANKRRGFHRPLNLTWSVQLPVDNKIVSGRWLIVPATDQTEISIEQGIAERLAVDLGDTLTFAIGEQQITAVITSIRTVQWDSFNPNFFVIYSPGVLTNFSHTYMTSFYVPQQNSKVLLELRNQFPSISIINVEQIIKRIDQVLAIAVKFVGFIWGFTLISGTILLLAIIFANFEERLRESNILKLLGTNHRQLFTITLTEFTLLGLIAATLGAILAVVTASVVAENVFYTRYTWQPTTIILWWLAAIFAIIVTGTSAARWLVK